MGKVLTHMTMSLDGFIADPDDQPGELFDWYQAGEVSVASANENIQFDVDESSADLLGDLTEAGGVIVSGRRLFDLADGWNDSHPAGARIVVVTHSPPADAAERWPKTTFVDGVEAAIAKAQEIAGDKNVTIASPNIIQPSSAIRAVAPVRGSSGEGAPVQAAVAHATNTEIQTANDGRCGSVVTASVTP